MGSGSNDNRSKSSNLSVDNNMINSSINNDMISHILNDNNDIMTSNLDVKNDIMIGGSNANNGMMTSIWGKNGWIFLHSITFGYSLEPTQDQKNNYRQFFESLADVLPCKYCRNSYKQFITTGDTKITDDVFKNRDSLTEWLYNIHEKVNNKLGVNYGLTLADVKAKYESFRAQCSTKPSKEEKGCVTPLNKKAEAYKNAYITDCPIIPYDLAKKFVYYAKLRGLEDQEFFYLRKFREDRVLATTVNDKCCNEWCKRNIECFDIIKNMRMNGKPSIEEKGDYTGLPTVDELKLILRLSSNLNKDAIAAVLDKLPKDTRNKKKIYTYVLVKA